MARAHLIADQRFRWLRFYDDVPAWLRAITQIDVCNVLTEQSRTWLAPHVRQAVRTERLLAAARLVVASWETGDLADAVRRLANVIAEAEGGAS
ncbi:hypothetical protein BSN85_16395 [Bradyrhizobium brasilense]|nr:hypothetical protein BSN85_16395 [Bradyrhizobium brasilense]